LQLINIIIIIKMLRNNTKNLAQRSL
jgi:hypothetical protein